MHAHRESRGVSAASQEESWSHGGPQVERRGSQETWDTAADNGTLGGEGHIGMDSASQGRSRTQTQETRATSVTERTEASSSMASKYVTMISQLTEELSRAQERIQELEGELEDKQELEDELEDLDKGNLELQGRSVALQRQVMSLTEERQDTLQVVSDLEERNAQLESNLSKLQEVANILQTKSKILQEKLARSRQPEALLDRKTNGLLTAQPGSLEAAFARIQELEDLNTVLRANLTQLQHQQQGEA